MEKLESRLEPTSGMLYASLRLSTWTLDRDFLPVKSNCPDQDFFYALLRSGSYETALQKHFAENRGPMVVTDRIGLGCVFAFLEDRYYILGPFLTLDTNESYIRKACHDSGIPQEMAKAFLSHLSSIPVIHFNSVNRFASILFYCLTLEELPESEIALNYEAAGAPHETVWTDRDWHGTWTAEKRMIQAIKNGDYDGYREAVRGMSTLHVGEMGNGNPLRQMKNMGIVYVTIMSRTAIEAGITPEGSYSLSDHYIQRIEACRFINDVTQILNEMTAAYFNRIQLAQKNSLYSIPVKNTMDYIETHVREKISLEDLADSVGYTAYYLSRKFQKETGKSITQFIQERKVEYAKTRFRGGHVTMAELAEELNFSSPSYFSSVFRKITGQSPMEYLDN